jgi:acyl-CoA dehydrogenase
VSDDDEMTRLVHSRIDDLETAITPSGKLDGEVAEARLFPLTQFIGDVNAGPW